MHLWFQSDYIQTLCSCFLPAFTSNCCSFSSVSVHHFPPLCFGFNDSPMGISHNPSLLSRLYDGFSSLHLCAPSFSLFLPLDVYFIILPSPTPIFCASLQSLCLFFCHFTSPILTSHRPTSLCLSVPVNPCLCVVGRSCLSFVFLPVSNSTYCLLFLSMNLSIDCLLHLLFFCFSAPLNHPPHLYFHLSLVSLC